MYLGTSEALDVSRLDADLLPLFQAARYLYGRTNLKCSVRARSHRRVTRRTRSTFDLTIMYIANAHVLYHYTHLQLLRFAPVLESCALNSGCNIVPKSQRAAVCTALLVQPPGLYALANARLSRLPSTIRRWNYRYPLQPRRDLPPAMRFA